MGIRPPALFLSIYIYLLLHQSHVTTTPDVDRRRADLASSLFNLISSVFVIPSKPHERLLSTLFKPSFIPLDYRFPCESIVLRRVQDGPQLG